MRPFTIGQVKIQLVEIFDEADVLTKGAFELAIFLVISSGALWEDKYIIKDVVIGEAKGWSEKTVSRNVQKLAKSGMFQIKRGRWNLASEYVLAEEIWNLATQRRLERDKSGGLRDELSPLNSPSTPPKRATKTPQKSRASKKLKRKITPDQAFDTPAFISESDKWQMSNWLKLFSEEGLGELPDVLQKTTFEGRDGYWLPGRYAYEGGTEMRRRQVEKIQLWIADGVPSLAGANNIVKLVL